MARIILAKRIIVHYFMFNYTLHILPY